MTAAKSIPSGRSRFMRESHVMGERVKNLTELKESLEEYKDEDVVRLSVFQQDGTYRYILLEIPN